MDSDRLQERRKAGRGSSRARQGHGRGKHDKGQLEACASNLQHDDAAAELQFQHIAERQTVDTKMMAKSKKEISLNPAAAPFTPVTNILPSREQRQTPRYSLRKFHTVTDSKCQEHTKDVGSSQADRPKRRLPVQGPAAPTPSWTYLTQSLLPPVQRASQQPLLVVLDLNGTLIARDKRTNTFKQRPGLQNFLSYLFQYHVPMVFTSARPENANKMCDALFTPQQRRHLAAIWGRDRLGLTRAQYIEKVQVYKRLDHIWNDKTIQTKHPKKQKVWSQSNTVLVDDSILKGLSQPHNLLLVPEFEHSRTESEADAVFRELVLKLEELKMQTDVSRLIRRWQAGIVSAPKPPQYRDNQKNDLETWLAEGAAKVDDVNGVEIIAQDLNTLIGKAAAIQTFAAGDETSDEEDEVQKELRSQMANLGTGNRTSPGR